MRIEGSTYDVPEIQADWCLFLDLDGTLLDLAATPDQVGTPAELSQTLQKLSMSLDGALAIVSGRTMAEIDRFLSPERFPLAAEHGAVIRGASGRIDEIPTLLRPPDQWITWLQNMTRSWEGVVVEPKLYSLAVHFRLAPEREGELRALTDSLVSYDPKRFELLAAKMAFEIRPKDATKGRAVSTFMSTKPFRGRVPVFVGDDVTDEDGMEAARRLGGMGLRVATMFGGKPCMVRAWLRRAAKSLNVET
jgi:trehalose 6-phosphate phosphatase